MKDKQKTDLNYQMCILSVISICFVVFGHIQNDSLSLGTFYGWFPYYSFHLPAFLFISGYFFKELKEGRQFFKSFGGFVLKKVRTILIPYYLVNGLFMILNGLLLNAGFRDLTPFSLVHWLISPWVEFGNITFALPTWYLPALFLTELFFVAIRKLISMVIKKDLPKEIVMLSVTLIMGIAAFYLYYRFSLPETAGIYIRSVGMIFFVELGLVYKKYIEKIDRIPSVYYFLILIAAQFVIIIISDNASLFPILQGLQNMGRFGFGLYAGGVTGIALWLRVARILSAVPVRSRLVIFIGRNTKYIMAFHLLGFLLVNLIISTIIKHGGQLIKPEMFDNNMFMANIYYTVKTVPRLKIVYFIAGMAVSLLLAWIIGMIKKQISLGIYSLKMKTRN